MADEQNAASPTGTPVIPVKWAPIVALVGIILPIVSNEIAKGGPWDQARIVQLVGVQILPVILAASLPGFRRPAPVASKEEAIAVLKGGGQ